MAVNLTENQELLAQLEAAEHENYEVAEYLRQELESRDEQIAELHARIEEVGQYHRGILLRHTCVALLNLATTCLHTGCSSLQC